MCSYRKGHLPATKALLLSVLDLGGMYAIPRTEDPLGHERPMTPAQSYSQIECFAQAMGDR